MQRLEERFGRGTFGRAIQVLSRKDQQKVLAVLFLQVCIGVLDLLGVIAIGLLGALSVTGLQSHEPGNRVSSALNFLQLSMFRMSLVAFSTLLRRFKKDVFPAPVLPNNKIL